MITQNGKKELNEIIEYYSDRPEDPKHELDSILDDLLRVGDIDDKDEAREYVENGEIAKTDEMTLEKIKKAIAEDTIEYLNDAFSDSYGTEGELRYFQDVRVDGIEIRISFQTTQDYDEWSELYEEWTDLRNNGQRTDNEELRYQELKSSDIANSHFIGDESCVCEWENPIDFEITE